MEANSINVSFFDSKYLEEQTREPSPASIISTPLPKQHQQKEQVAKIIEEQTESPEILVEEDEEQLDVSDKPIPEDDEWVKDILEAARPAESSEQHPGTKRYKKKTREILQRWKSQSTIKRNEFVKNREERLLISPFVRGIIGKRYGETSRKNILARVEPTMSKATLRFYLVQVNRAITPFWEIPRELDSSLSVRVKVKVGKTGIIDFFEIVEFSGNKLLDQAVYKVFRQVKKLPPLPTWYEGNFLEFGLNFAPTAITGN